MESILDRRDWEGFPSSGKSTSKGKINWAYNNTCLGTHKMLCISAAEATRETIVEDETGRLEYEGPCKL